MFLICICGVFILSPTLREYKIDNLAEKETVLSRQSALCHRA